MHPRAHLAVAGLCSGDEEVVCARAQTTEESETPKPSPAMPLSLRVALTIHDLVQWARAVMFSPCRITAAFVAFLSFCSKWSRNLSEAKWTINEKTTIQSGLYKDEAYYELILLLLNMHEFLISRAKNRAMYHRISPGCTIFIHLHPAKKWTTAERILIAHFYIAITGPNSSIHKNPQPLGSWHKRFWTAPPSTIRLAGMCRKSAHPSPNRHRSHSPVPICNLCVQKEPISKKTPALVNSNQQQM